MRRKDSALLVGGKESVQNIFIVLFIILFAAIGIKLLLAGHATPALKPPVKGLMMRDGSLPASPAYIDNLVIQVKWSDLSPSAANQADINDFSAPGWKEIDNLLAGRAVGVRLRILAGVNAPNWVKSTYPSGKGAISSPASGSKPAVTCSAGIAYRNDFDGVSGCIPYFWTTSVLDKYQQLMHKVASRYESNAKVRDVVDSACMTEYAEPFFRAGTGNYDNLHTAGLTFALDRACQERGIMIHKSEFATTRTSLAINAWDNVDTRQREWPIAQDFGNWAKAQMGDKLMLQNNGFGVQEGCPTYTGSNGGGETHCFIAHSGLVHGWQTRTYSRLAADVYPNADSLSADQKCPYFKEGLIKTLENAKRSGATYIELPSQPAPADCKYDKIDAYRLSGFSTLQQYDAAFEANSPGGSTPPPPTDNPPTVTITTPSDGATVSGSSVPIAADAHDDHSVSKVEFYIGSELKNTDASAPYSFAWDTTTIANAHYNLTAKAYDGAGHMTTSAVVTITVNNSSAGGSTGGSDSGSSTGGDTGTITPPAPSADPGDTITVAVDGHQVGSSSNGTVPTIDTTTLSDGKHTVEVKVTKPDGTTKSEGQTISVDNHPSLITRIRNTLLKPLAGKSAKTLNIVFSGIVATPFVLGGAAWFGVKHGVNFAFWRHFMSKSSGF